MKYIQTLLPWKNFKPSNCKLCPKNKYQTLKFFYRKIIPYQAISNFGPNFEPCNFILLTFSPQNQICVTKSDFRHKIRFPPSSYCHVYNLLCGLFFSSTLSYGSSQTVDNTLTVSWLALSLLRDSLLLPIPMTLLWRWKLTHRDDLLCLYYWI